MTREQFGDRLLVASCVLAFAAMLFMSRPPIGDIIFNGAVACLVAGIAMHLAAGTDLMGEL